MREDGTYISLPYSREEVVPNFQYQALEGGRYINFSTTLSRGRRWYLNFVTIVSREGGTEISLLYSREEVVLKFQYQALEGLWYLNFGTCSREEVVHKFQYHALEGR